MWDLIVSVPDHCLSFYPTQHVFRQFIDSETNHKRHFIKIPFINKGVEFIDLPSIFKDRSVTPSIPTYSVFPKF